MRSGRSATGRNLRKPATAPSLLFCRTIRNCGRALMRAAIPAPGKNARNSKSALTQMQNRAKEADLIIVNHHLFFADLALKQDDFGSILREYSAVVFDEAHEMEDVASDYFGQQISNYRFEELARDADHAMRLTKT